MGSSNTSSDVTVGGVLTTNSTLALGVGATNYQTGYTALFSDSSGVKVANAMLFRDWNGVADGSYYLVYLRAGNWQVSPV
jgi:hypothetical protein